MLTFLFEQYGYYPNDFVDNSFEIDGWLFKLLEINCDNSYIDKINDYIEQIRFLFNGKGSFIIKTRFDENVSIYDSKMYVLISVYKENMNLLDLNKFHCYLLQEKKILNLNDLLNLWKNRLEDIEKNAVNSLMVDGVFYKDNIEVSMFCFGLAQNAVQYLSEIIENYGSELENLTVVHRRLCNLDSFDFFNPFNMIVDHPVRDLSELYKNDCISFSEFVKFIDYYDLNSKTSSILMARILYPAKILDLLDKNIYKKEINLKLPYNIEKELSKIKKIYLQLKSKYNIRPIDWLEN